MSDKVTNVRLRGRGHWAASQHSKIVLRCSAYPGVPNLMSSFVRSSLVTALLLIPLQLVFSDDTKAPDINPELAAADQLYRAGKFAEAEASYLSATQGRCEAGACARWAGAGNVAATED